MMIAIAGIVSVTPDAVLVRWASHLGAGRLAIVFFKMLSAFSFTIAWVMISEGRTMATPKRLALRCRGGVRYMVGAMVVQALVSIHYPVALLLTYAANVVLLSSLQPVWSALLGWFFLHDPLPVRTLIALVGSVVAVLLMFAPRIVSSQDQHGSSSNDLGMVIAIGLGLGMSAYVLLARTASLKSPDVPLTLASALGALLGALIVAVFTAFTDGSLARGVSPMFFLVMAIDGVCSGSIFIAFSIAPRYIPGVQIGLLSLLEVILGPIWVLIIYNERPPLFTLIGGTVLVLTVTGHEYAGLRAEAVHSRRATANVVTSSPRPSSVELAIADAKKHRPLTAIDDAEFE